MTRSSILAVALMLARTGRSTAQAVCDQRTLADAVAIDSASIPSFAGHYELVLVDTVTSKVPTVYQRIALTLSLPDSGWRWPGVVLLGKQVPLGPPTRFAGDTAWGRTAWIGRKVLVGVFLIADGAGELLMPERAAPSGFRGQWEHSDGLAVVYVTDNGSVTGPPPEPAGYFCALRR